jgi:t-SNARE complex subunit (syntaxin)
MDRNDELFKGTTFADLMSDVYHNSKKKDRQINQLIAQLQPLIKNASDATIIVPLIKTDDHLVKLTAIVQRYISTKQTISGADSLLSEEEKQQLLKVAEQTLSDELTDELDNISYETDELAQRVEIAKRKLEKDVNDSI